VKDMSERDKKIFKTFNFDETLIEDDYMKSIKIFEDWPYGRALFSNES
jgi:hypothetical protein